ncbi:LamG-like jellyroll fold domain-containing protein [Streptomyces sp. NPDC002513]
MLATALGLLMAVPVLPAAAEDAPAPSDPMLAAQEQAVSTGQPVLVDTLTTEVSTTEAQPDGTFSSTTDVMPVRVRKDGAWTPVDATLATNSDGTLSPKATPNDVTLSGGGSGPLVTLTNEDGHSMALTMPFALPAPTVSDDTALYTSVLPGVDLSVSVTNQGGFSDVLIVHDATAATNPDIKKLTEAASTQGLSLSATASGGMNATASDGTVDYTSPRPLMWDSSTVPDAPAENPSAGSTPVGDPAVSSTDGPGTGANVDTVPMTTTANSLTLTPDTTVLNDSGTTYPIYIDPFSNPVTKASGHYDELYSSSSCSNSPQYDKPQTNGQGVGYQRWGGSCGTGLERSYYAVPTDGLDPSMVVNDAFFTVSSTYAASWDCSQNQPITLHTTNAISSSTDWNSRPSVQDGTYPPVSTTIPSGANSGSSCSNHTATFTVTDQAQKMADTNSSSGDYWTIGLYGDESISSSNDDYLRMSSVLTLTVKFDIPPNVPTSLHTTPAASGASGACVTSGDGWIGATTYSDAGSNIQLHSTVTTNMSGVNVQAHYHVWDRTVLDSGGNTLDKSTPDSTYQASGSDADMPIGFTLKDGHEYGWDVYAQDNSSQHLASATSGHCWFKTDFTPPDTPDIATNPSFPPVGTGPATDHAAPGKTTSFTVTAADGAASDTSCTPNACLSSGVDHFLWQLDSQPTATTGTKASVTSTDSAGTATGTVTVPLTNWGVHNLYVAAVDAAGNISQAPASYTFAVPWNPDAKITPGDISGDGIPDLLATTKTGDLEMIPGNTDPAQSATPAQTGQVTDTPPPINGPVIVSTPADSPDGSSWNDYLIAHRGNLHGADVDDLFAYNRKTAQLYVVPNDLDPKDDSAFPLVPWSDFPGYIGQRSGDPVTKDPCQPIVPDSRCAGAGYDPTTPWNITQLIAPGNVYGNEQGHPAVITVENGKLWIYQSNNGKHLTDPVLLGDGDWSGLSLIAPGTVGGTLSKDANGNGTITGGTYTLWARDDASGTVYTFPLSLDQGTGLPQLLHAPVRTALTSALTTSTGGSLCLDDDHSGTDNNNKIQIWTCNGSAAQKWALLSDGSLRVLGKCLDVPGGATTDGTLLQLYTCNGTGAQKWTPGPNGSLQNSQSGKCLDDPRSSSTNGTQVQIYTCNGGANQNWTNSTPANWSTNPGTALSPVLAAIGYPTVASSGDVNSSSGGSDGNPDLYATDTNGQLTEYPGNAPTGTTATFGAPVSLGTATNTATHSWTLNEGTGTTAADCANATSSDCSTGLTASLTGAYTWASDSTRGNVLNLAGTTGYAATSGPAVDTSTSFTISAWANLNSLTANSTFVSQSDSTGNANGFQLYYSSGKQAWAFGRHDDDTTSTSFTATYGGTPKVGTWTHLVGIYDATTNQLSLYVNGRLSGTKAFAGTSWNATGPLQIGRRLFQGTYGEYTNGEVSDIHVYDTALPPADAAATGDNPSVTQLD